MTSSGFVQPGSVTRNVSGFGRSQETLVNLPPPGSVKRKVSGFVPQSRLQGTLVYSSPQGRLQGTLVGLSPQGWLQGH